MRDRCLGLWAQVCPLACPPHGNDIGQSELVAHLVRRTWIVAMLQQRHRGLMQHAGSDCIGEAAVRM